jgi:hypothetical protein
MITREIKFMMKSYVSREKSYTFSKAVGDNGNYNDTMMETFKF